MLGTAVVGGCLPSPSANTPDQTASSPVPVAASAKPSPTPRAFVKAIDAFVERVTTGKLSYHVAFDGSVRASVNLLPIVGSMEIIAGGQKNPKMRDLVNSIRSDIESGTSFSEALGKHPVQFDEPYRNLVKAGESAGVLDTVLDTIATYKENIESLKGKIKKAMFYPAMVVAVALLVSAILLVFVVPQFEEVFANFGADLPAFTKLIIGISDFTGTIDFGAGPINSASSNAADAYVVKYDPAGNLLWNKTFGDAGYQYAGGAITDGSGNILFTGGFGGSIGFGGATFTNTDATSYDMYVVKLGP